MLVMCELKVRERLLDALLVADVGEDAAEDGQRAAVVGGDVQPGLRHQRQQARPSSA